MLLISGIKSLTISYFRSLQSTHDFTAVDSLEGARGMKALVVLATFGLVLANGFRLPFRAFGGEYLRNAEMRKFEDDAEPKEAER